MRGEHTAHSSLSTHLRARCRCDHRVDRDPSLRCRGGGVRHALRATRGSTTRHVIGAIVDAVEVIVAQHAASSLLRDDLETMNSPFALRTKNLGALLGCTQSQSQGTQKTSQGSQDNVRPGKAPPVLAAKGRVGRQLNLALSQVTLGSPVEGLARRSQDRSNLRAVQLAGTSVVAARGDAVGVAPDAR